jgi:hypothetical protein
VIEWNEDRVTPVRTPGNRHALVMSRDGAGIIFGAVDPDGRPMEGSPLAVVGPAELLDAHRLIGQHLAAQGLLPPPLCPACPAELIRDATVISHDDDCPWLAAERPTEHPCQAAATGFCSCAGGDHD